jgi:hypothetical protein
MNASDQRSSVDAHTPPAVAGDVDAARSSSPQWATRESEVALLPDADATSAPTGVRRRRRRAWVIGVAVVVTLAAAGFVLATTRQSDRDSTPEWRVFDAGGVVDFLDAGLGTVVVERQPTQGAGMELARLGADGTVEPFSELERAAHTFQGVDVGTDHGGERALVYSRCTTYLRTCDLWVYRLNERVSVPVPGASRPDCDESGPTISDGLIAFREKAGAGCDNLGLHLRTPDRRLREISDGVEQPDYAEFAGDQLAWLTEVDSALQLNVEPVADPEAREELAPSPGHSFDGPLVLDGGYLYFLESVSQSEDGPFYVARVRLPLSGGVIERYGNGPGITFTPRPKFTVANKTLYYSGDTEDPDDGPTKIVRDGNPEFTRAYSGVP